MLSINMRVFKTVLLIAFFGASVQCLPVTDKLAESTTESKIESQTASKVESQTEAKPEIASEVIPQDEAAVTTAAPTPTISDIVEYYDQRQNGTDNYRIHLDGLVFVFAPVEALLLAGAAGGTLQPNLPISSQDHASSTIQSIDEPDKPAIDSLQNKTDLPISKTILYKQPAVRLANFLAPLIRSIRHAQGTSVH